MGAVVEQLIRGSDVQIKLQLTEDGLPTFGAWDSVEVHIGGVVLERTADGDGVELSTATGILVLTPANLLTAEKTELLTLNRQLYHVTIVVYSTLNDDGVVFGGAGSTHILFNISDRPD